MKKLLLATTLLAGMGTMSTSALANCSINVGAQGDVINSQNCGDLIEALKLQSNQDLSVFIGNGGGFDQSVLDSIQTELDRLDKEDHRLVGAVVTESDDGNTVIKFTTEDYKVDAESGSGAIKTFEMDVSSLDQSQELSDLADDVYENIENIDIIYGITDDNTTAITNLQNTQVTQSDIDGAVATETDARENADDNLQEQITNNESAIYNEVDERLNADEVLTDKIDTEVSAREEADLGLGSRITLNTELITTNYDNQIDRDAAQDVRMDGMDAFVQEQQLYNTSFSNSINSNTSRINSLENKTEELTKGVAMAGAFAMGAGMHTLDHDNRWVIMPSLAHYEGETALAVQLQVAFTDHLSARFGYANSVSDMKDFDKGLVGGAVALSF